MSDTFPLAKKIGIVQPAANLDYRYGPWPTVQRALEVTAGLRQLGLTVAVSSVSTGAIEYHFKNGIADIDLIVKSVDLSGYLPLSGGSLTGNISTNNIIYAKTGNSDLWNSGYVTYNVNSGLDLNARSFVNQNSSDLINVESKVILTSSNWDSVYGNVNLLSSNWESNYSTVCSLSGDWESVYSQVLANSSFWQETYITVQNNSGTTWNYQGTDLKQLSGRWESSYTTLNANSSLDLNARSFVNSNSTNILNVNTTVNNTSANWNSVYSHWNSNSASVVAAETFVENNSANINNVLSRVNSTSANWNSVYSAWNNVSSLDLNVRTYVNSNSSNINNVLTRVNTTSSNWNSVYSSWNSVSGLELNVRTYVNSNSSNINNVLSRVNSTSANWNSVYSIYNTNSASYATQQYTADNFLALSGGYVRGDVSIGGNLFLLGTATQISTEDLILTNSLIFLASGNPSDVVDIGFVGYTSGSQFGQRFTGLIRDSFNKKWYLFSQLSSLSGSDVNINNPSLQIDTLKANIEGNLVANTNVFGNLSASGNIFGENLKIQNWNTAFDYTTVYSNNSSKYESVYSNINSVSSNWNSVYNHWNSNSAELINVGNFVKNTSANNSVFSTVCAFSANWNSVYAYVNQASGNEANQQNVVSFILSNSSNIINVNTRVNSTSANWNSVYSSWNSNSASIISAETFVENNSANIVNVNTKVNSSSANWDSVYSWTNVTSSTWSNLGRLTSTIVTDLSVGAITAAQVLPAGTTFQQFAEALLTKIYYPTYSNRSLGVTSNHGGNGTNVEIGTQSVTLTLTYTRGEIKGKTNNSIWDPNFLQGYRTGTATNYIIFGNTTTSNIATSANAIISEGANTYNVTCNFGAGDQPVDSKNNPFDAPLPANSVSNSITLNGRRRAFFGADANTFVPNDSNQVRALPQSLLAPVEGSTFTINVPSNARRVIIAYPATLRNVTQIYYPPLQSDVKNTFTLTTVSVSAANSLFPTNYKVYYYTTEIDFGSTTTYQITI